MTDVIDQTNLAEVVCDLQRDSQAMKDMLDTWSRVTVTANRRDPFLGQPVVVTARVTGSLDKQPRSDARVSVTTAVGCLRAVEGFRQLEGNALDLRTDGNGEVRLTLLPESGELWPQDMITGLQAVLLPLAESGAQPEEGGRALVAAYRWQPNYLFREAADRLYELNRARLEHAAGHVLSHWPELGVAVSVFVHEEGVAVTGSSLYPFSFKDWLPPFVSTYLGGDTLAERLRIRLQAANKLSKGTSGAMAGFQDQIRMFVGEQRGRLGNFASGLAASKALNTFLKEDLSEEAPEVRKALDAGLRATQNALGGQGAELLAGLGDLRGELRQELTREIDSIDISKVKGLDSSLNELRGTVSAKANLSEVKLIVDNTHQRINELDDGARRNIDELRNELRQKADLTELRELSRITETNLSKTLTRDEFRGFEQANEQRLNVLVTRDDFAGFRTNEFAPLKTTTETGLQNAYTRKEFQVYQRTTKRHLDTMVTNKTFAEFKKINEAEFAKRDKSTKTFRTRINKTLASRLETRAFVALRDTLVRNLEKLQVRGGFRLEGAEILKPKKNSHLTPVIENLDLSGLDLGFIRSARPIRLREPEE